MAFEVGQAASGQLERVGKAPVQAKQMNVRDGIIANGPLFVAKALVCNFENWHRDVKSF